MPKTSAGLLMYRLNNGQLEVFLAHPGGPYFKNKDIGYWGIPKGEIETAEDLLDGAIREFIEETGLQPQGDYFPLGSVVLASGKTVYAWAFEGQWDESAPLKSNLFPLEWPPKSGNELWFPEIDEVTFFPVALALQKINPRQAEYIRRLERFLQSI